jgi:hypothetical protein
MGWMICVTAWRGIGTRAGAVRHGSTASRLPSALSVQTGSLAYSWSEGAGFCAQAFAHTSAPSSKAAVNAAGLMILMAFPPIPFYAGDKQTQGKIKKCYYYFKRQGAA